MKNNITEIVFILDMSGSMHHLTDDTIGGFNALIDEHRGKDEKALVTTVLFNNDNVRIHDRLPIAEVPAMTEKEYSTSGCTALIDALGDTIRHIEEVHRYIRPEDVPDSTLFLITTDGMENASHKYSSDDVKKMVTEKQELGWDFVFLAANIDAVETAKSYGFDERLTVPYRNDEIGTKVKFRAMSDACYLRVNRISLTNENAAWRNLVDEDYKKRK